MTSTGPELTARLDRLTIWPYPIAVLWIVGVGYFIAFFDITNVAFGLPVFSKLFSLTAAQQAYPISASLFGYILGAWINGNVSDLVGRKRGIVVATLLFSAGCLGATFSNGLLSMVGWRFITGMGIGAEIAIISTYVGELAPSSMRGRYTGLINVFSFAGLAFVPVLALWLVPGFEWGWRAMFMVGALGILTVPALIYVPESPRWLLSKLRFAEAETVIKAAEQRVQQRLGVAPTPVSGVAVETKVAGLPTAQLFHQPYRNRLILLLTMWLFWYAGEYIWLGLGPTFFVDRGYTLSRSITFMLMSAVGLPAGALLSAWLGDTFERKYSIMAGMVVWTAAFAVIAMVDNTPITYACVLLVTVALGFVIPLMYALTNESFPTGARSTGVSLTDGLGHLGGAAGPIIATSVYAMGGASLGFMSVFLLVTATGLVSVLIIPFSVSATRRAIGGSKPQATGVKAAPLAQPAE